MARQSTYLENISPLAAAVGGAILGAAAVAAFALSDRDYREKMTKSVSDLHKSTMKKLPTMPSVNLAMQGTKHGTSRRRRRGRKPTQIEGVMETRGRKRK